MLSRIICLLSLAGLAAGASAQAPTCELPPGTIALGRYCARPAPADQAVAASRDASVPAAARPPAEPAVSAGPAAPATSPTVPPSSVPAPPRPQRAAGVAERGQRARAATLATEGRDIPLRDALRAVVPPAYAVRPTACVPQQAPVSWRRGGDWVDALDQLAAGLDLRAVVDHDLGEVFVDKPPRVAPEAVRTWAALRSDGSLRRSLERWTQPACVQLEWDLPHPLDVSADRLYPDMTLWEALRQLAADLEASDTPIQITRHANAVRVTAGHQR